ncbi:MAG: hypothetical protein IJ598_04610 [Ruminococcus sp.]|nr:hypothetical protein [Ruminococcus sp.]
MKLRKTIALILCLVLALSSVSLFAVSASAAENDVTINVTSNVPELFPASTTVVDGDSNQVTVTYWINTTNYDIVNTQFYLTYDNEVLSYDATEGVNKSGSTYKIVKPALEYGGLVQINLNAKWDVEGKTCIRGNSTSVDSYYNAGSGRMGFISVTFNLRDDRTVNEANVNLDMQVIQVRPVSDRDLAKPSIPSYFVQNGEIVKNDVEYVSDSTYALAYEGGYNEQYLPGPCYDADLKASLTSLAFNTGIAVYMQVNKTVLNGYTDPYMVFNYVDYFGNDIEKVVTAYEDAGTTYNFRIDGILPQMMTTEISGVLHAEKNGVEYYGDARVDTIHDYIGRGLAAVGNNNSYANLRTLLIDLANYGAEVQKYLNYKTDHLANEGFDAYQQYATATVAPEYQRDFAYAPAEAADGTAWKTTSLALGDVIKTNAYFTTDSITGKTVKVTYYNAKGEAVEKIFTTEEIQKDKNGYYVNFVGLFPQQMDEPAYFTVYNADGKSCSPTMKYTINSYLNKAIAGTTGQLHNLLVATAKYGVSTQKYANYQVKG